MSWGSSVIPGSMMTWQEWFGLLSKCSVIWSAPEASARKSHLRHTSVRLLEQKRERKKKITFCKFTSKKNPSITVKYDILYQNLPQTTWRLPCFYKPYFWRTVVKPADEKTTTIKRSDHSHLELFIHSFIHVLPLPDHMLFECLLATWSKLAYSAL